jgi:hypothetical protein
MRWALTAATLVALALATALAVRTFKAAPGGPATVSAAPCPDLSLRPSPAMLELSAAPLLIEVEPGVHLLLDDAAPGSSLLEGAHTLLATAPGAKPANLKLQVDAFTPVLLEARVSSGSVTVLMVGARCATCANTGADPDLRYSPSLLGDLRAVSTALADGDWPQAAHAMRAIAPSDREAPEAARLLAVLYALAGRPSVVRETLAQLPETGALRKALTRRDALEELKQVRQLETATARWNATTERFQRLTDRFVAEAPTLLVELTRRFGTFSKNFADAREKQDAIACESALEAANVAMGDLIMALRAQRPTDCDWQKRLTAAF